MFNKNLKTQITTLENKLKAVDQKLLLIENKYEDTIDELKERHRHNIKQLKDEQRYEIQILNEQMQSILKTLLMYKQGEH